MSNLGKYVGKENMELAIARMRAGEATSKGAKEVGISRAHLNRVRIALGIPTLPKGGSREYRGHRAIERRRPQAAAKLAVLALEGEQFNVLAERFLVDRNHIRNFLKRLGIYEQCVRARNERRSALSGSNYKKEEHN